MSKIQISEGERVTSYIYTGIQNGGKFDSILNLYRTLLYYFF